MSDIGLPVTKQDLDITTGDISKQMQMVCNRVVEMKRYLDQYTPSTLAAEFGYSEADANVIISAFVELQMVVDTQVANRQWSSKLSGMGDV